MYVAALEPPERGDLDFNRSPRPYKSSSTFLYDRDFFTTVQITLTFDRTLVPIQVDLISMSFSIEETNAFPLDILDSTLLEKCRLLHNDLLPPKRI